MKRKNDKIRYITFTAVLIALAVAFQTLRTIIPAIPVFGIVNTQQLVVGSFINMTLFISVWAVGLWSGLSLAVLTAVLAFFQGAMPVPHMMIAVAVANIMLILTAWALRKQLVVSIVFAAPVKFGTLYALMTYFFIQFVQNEKQAAILAAFTWPQLITAALGGILALIIYPVLRKGM